MTGNEETIRLDKRSRAAARYREAHPLLQKICLCCGEWFVPEKSNAQQLCSRRCENRWGRQRAKAKGSGARKQKTNDSPKLCVVCGSLIPADRLYNCGDHTKTCSSECSAEKIRKARRNRERARRKRSIELTKKDYKRTRKWQKDHPEMMRYYRWLYRDRHPETARAWGDRGNAKKMAAIRALKDLGIEV